MCFIDDFKDAVLPRPLTVTKRLSQVSVSNVGKVCTEPAKPARPWGTCITPTASPAAPVVSQTCRCGETAATRPIWCQPEAKSAGQSDVFV